MKSIKNYYWIFLDWFGFNSETIQTELIIINSSLDLSKDLANRNIKHIANLKLTKQVLTQNFILNRMALFSASESQYNTSKAQILRI